MPFLVSGLCLEFVMVAALRKRAGLEDWFSLSGYLEVKSVYTKDIQPVLTSIFWQFFAVSITFCRTIRKSLDTGRCYRRLRGVCCALGDPIDVPPPLPHVPHCRTTSVVRAGRGPDTSMSADH